ncbi:cytochrome P450 [Phascolomyces articulosus]|uniref:Cytochrome P450 n=1 Tax=Phascolomyces articulosus TaxID=60185 RepID=A0AAD5PDS0_9FUNG|nr:cytochrome P450 [Phascolomyces articulosus]
MDQFLTNINASTEAFLNNLPQQLEQGKESILTLVSKWTLQYQQQDTQQQRQRLWMTTSGVLLGSWLFYRVFLKSHKNDPSKRTNVPLVHGAYPIIGHTIQASMDPLGFVQRCREQYGPVFRIRLNGREFTVVTGKVIPEIFSLSRKHVDVEKGMEKILPLYRVIRLSYNHKQKPEVLSPRDRHPVMHPLKTKFKPDGVHVFNERIMKAFEEVLDDQLKLAPGEKKIVDPWNFFAQSVSKISCLCFIGSRVGTDERLIAAMARFTQSIIEAAAPLIVLPDTLGDMVVKRFFSVEPHLDILMDLIVPLLTQIRNGEIPDDEPTFVSMALHLPKNDGSMRSVRDAAFWFKDVAMASIHTTTHFTTFALHELSCRPELVEALRTEIGKLGEKRNPDDIGKIKLLDSFLREVLRYNIDNLTLLHLVVQDVILSTGHLVPKGALIINALEDAHKDPALYDENDPVTNTPMDQFDAYRFMNLPDKPSSKIGDDLISFGLGSHACPGRYFAVHEIKYVLAELLMRYNITTKSGARGKDINVTGMVKFPPKEHLVFEGR